MKKNLIYLASPYSHDNEDVRQVRADQAAIAAGVLSSDGLLVYSPIAHSHSIAKLCSLPVNFEFYREFDERMISVCDCLYVLTIDGWRESKGIQSEKETAKELGKPIHFITPAMIEQARTRLNVRCLPIGDRYTPEPAADIELEPEPMDDDLKAAIKNFIIVADNNSTPGDRIAASYGITNMLMAFVGDDINANGDSGKLYKDVCRLLDEIVGHRLGVSKKIEAGCRITKTIVDYIFRESRH